MLRRVVHGSDVAEYLGVYRSLAHDVMASGRLIGSRAGAVARRMVAEQLVSELAPLRTVISYKDEPAGIANLMPRQQGDAYIGFAVREEFRRRKLGSLAARALTEYGLESGWSPIRAQVLPDNIANLNLLGAIDFVPVGYTITSEEPFTGIAGIWWELAYQRILPNAD